MALAYFVLPVLKKMISYNLMMLALKNITTIVRSSAAEYLALKKAFKTGELDENSVTRIFRATASNGKIYDTKHHNLKAIISWIIRWIR